MVKTSVCDAAETFVSQQNSICDEMMERRPRAQVLRGKPAIRRQSENLPDSFAGLGALGSVVSVIEHEINQPLHAIVNLTDASLYVLEATPVVAHPNLIGWLKQVAEQAQRAAQIIRQAGCLVEHTPSKRSAVSMNELVRDCVKFLNVDLRAHAVRLCCEFCGTLPRVAADAAQIQLVLVNLMCSAVDAVSQHSTAHREILIRTALVADKVQVSMHDSRHAPVAGKGPHLFESLLSNATAPSSLALAFSRSMVRTHDGCLWADPTADRGPALFLSLPALQENTGDV